MCTKKIFMQLILDKLLSYLTQDGLCTDPYPSHFTRNYQKSDSKLKRIMKIVIWLKCVEKLASQLHYSDSVTLSLAHNL